MKKLAARDFEDLLQVRYSHFIILLILIRYIQCSIPVFDGLLPQKHDKMLSKLLFELATWHGLAKLRLHTDTTLTNLETSSTRLCDLLRKFKTDTCSAYVMQDLPSERLLVDGAKLQRHRKPRKQRKVQDKSRLQKRRNSMHSTWKRTNFTAFQMFQQQSVHLELPKIQARKM